MAPLDLTQRFSRLLFADEKPVQENRTETLKKVDELGKGGAILAVLSGANSGARYLLDSNSIIIGRSENANIFLDDITVSREHAKITKENDGNFYIKDLNSMNGTYVNLENVIETQKLNNEDIVQIGKFRLTFFQKK
jgi:pSer/pThr/pTyr-binding forkhead associated (FHA) protein